MAKADVTLRRLQRMKIDPGAAFRWQFGDEKGEANADAQGLVTVPALEITGEPKTLRIRAVSGG